MLFSYKELGGLRQSDSRGDHHVGLNQPLEGQFSPPVSLTDYNGVNPVVSVGSNPILVALLPWAFGAVIGYILLRVALTYLRGQMETYWLTCGGRASLACKIGVWLAFVLIGGPWPWFPTKLVSPLRQLTASADVTGVVSSPDIMATTSAPTLGLQAQDLDSLAIQVLSPSAPVLMKSGSLRLDPCGSVEGGLHSDLPPAYPSLA